MADKIKYAFNYEQKTTKPVWKIHRSKAKKIFDAIHCILNKYDNPEIFTLFTTICNNYGFSSYQDAVGSPYNKVICNEELLKAQEYNDTEIRDLIACSAEIQKFSILNN